MNYLFSLSRYSIISFNKENIFIHQEYLYHKKNIKIDLYIFFKFDTFSVILILIRITKKVEQSAMPTAYH